MVLKKFELSIAIPFSFTNSSELPTSELNIIGRPFNNASKITFGHGSFMAVCKK